MLSVAGQPQLDKKRLIGACTRLPMTCDADRLRAQVLSLPESYWGTRAGREGVHNPTQAVFLRGHAPAAGDLPIEDREALSRLPYVRELIELIGGIPMRCLLAKLPSGALITPHKDDGAPYFGQTLRIHVPVVTHDQVWMFCAGKTYQMRVGEVWALNNSAPHSVWNADSIQDRIHLICDFLPAPRLLELLAAGERDLGVENSGIREQMLAAAAAGDATA